MPLYRWNADNLEAVPPSTFEAEQLQEANLQRLLRDQPDVLEEGLFIISEEYSNWQDSYRSIDLLGLDRTGRLVVIELKRTQSGDHSELQAIRYAAMVSNMTLEQIIEAHREYLVRRGKDEDARVHILGHLGVSEEADAEIRTKDPRIVGNQQKWHTLEPERSWLGWRSGEFPEGPVVLSSPFDCLSLYLLPAL